MNLKEKIQTILIEDSGNLQKICFMEDIADEFAIDFAEWICEKAEVPYIKGTMNGTLKIYKKEKGL